MKIRLDHPVTLAAVAFLVTAALLGATQVHAQVTQIADDGSVQTRAGVGVVIWDADDIPDTPWPDPATSLPSMPAIPAAYAATVYRVAAVQGIRLANYRETRRRDMGSMSMVHWLVVLAVMALPFGGARIANNMGDLGKGLKVFRQEMAGVESPSAPSRLEVPSDR